MTVPPRQEHPWTRRFRRLNAGTLTFTRFDVIIARAKRIRGIR